MSGRSSGRTGIRDKSSGDRPDIVWVNCDQLRWDAVGYAGNTAVHTPNIDRLATRGAVFEQAYCASPVCSPARASWLTGLYPHAHTMFNNYRSVEEWGARLGNDVATVTELLAEQGYTCGNVGAWHLGTDEHSQRGITEPWLASSYLYAEYPDPFFSYLEGCGLSNPYARDAEGVFRYGKEFPLGVLTDPRQQRTSWTIDRCIEALEASSAPPFCLLVGIKDPHPPVIPPQELLALYPLQELPFPENFHDPLKGKPSYQQAMRCRIPPGSVNVADFRTVIRYYYALVTHIDRELGRLVDCLDRLGRFDDTLFLFNSDHGEMLGNHGFVEKCCMYEEAVRVPCLVSWPRRIPAGQRVATPLAGVDLVPTLLELIGIGLPERIDGRSFAADLTAAGRPEARPVFAEIASDLAIYRGNRDRDQLAAHLIVRNDDWKYVWNRFDGDELYDLRSDPSE